MTAKLYPNQILIFDNFLSKGEVEDFKEKIFKLKDIWTYSPLGNSGRQFPLNYLPLSSHTGQHRTYIDEIKTKKQIMFDNFGIYYERIRQKLNEIFEIPARYHQNYHYPGFHIHGPGTDSIILEHGKDRLHIHNDTSMGAIPHVHVTNGIIYSFLIPIMIPKNGGGLIYYINSEKKEIDYHEGFGYLWSGGQILHGIKPFQLTDSTDYRITLQTFINVKKDYCGLFW